MRFFLSAGEPSGDLHGSNLIRELKKHAPESEFTGFGSREMEQAGCRLTHDMSNLAIMGFGRVVPHLWTFWNLLQQAERQFRETPPDALVLIDYPGFNWWLAKAAKRHGVPVFYFGTPQVWAWARHRVRKLRRFVDHSLCKLPFEPEWYREHGCKATYVGHPYFDDFLRQQLDDEFMASLGSDSLVTVLPGSRSHEVRNNLPAFLKTIDYVYEQLPHVRFAVASYDERQAQMAREIIMEHAGVARPTVHANRTRELIHHAACCLACSGSVSLELLHEAKPTVIHYKTDWLGDFLQKCFRRCKFITLVNLLNSEDRFSYRQRYDPDDVASLQEAPFPEYLTVGDRADNMAQHVIRWLTDETSRQAAIDALRPLKDSFVRPGASAAAAEYIMQQLSTVESNAEAPFPHQKVA